MNKIYYRGIALEDAETIPFTEWCCSCKVNYQRARAYASKIYKLKEHFGVEFEDLIFKYDVRDLADRYNRESDEPYKNVKSTRTSIYKYKEWVLQGKPLVSYKQEIR